MPQVFNCSFRCFFDTEENSRYTTHYQQLPIQDIPKWIESYKFTHPMCTSISVKIWLANQPSVKEMEEKE